LGGPSLTGRVTIGRFSSAPAIAPVVFRDQDTLLLELKKVLEMRFRPIVMAVLAWSSCSPLIVAQSGPFLEGRFVGRIAYDCDGNFNDPDDWIASPVALAILAESGHRERLVHFSYNNILPNNNAEWERIHAESVIAAAEHYAFDLSKFHDCQKDLRKAMESLTQAIDASTSEDPLYLIVAGPMEVAFRAIEKSDPSKRKFVFCISHSRWNDGFATEDKQLFMVNKRSIIETDVHWVQIQDQNRLLSHSRYGRPAKPEEFAPYFWMRDAQRPAVRFLWDRMVVSTRPDPSDAGMAWFLVTGDEEVDPGKLQRLLLKQTPPDIIAERQRIRIEAENFASLEYCRLEFHNDPKISHRLNVVCVEPQSGGRIDTQIQQPYMAKSAIYDLELRIRSDGDSGSSFRILLNGKSLGEAIEASTDATWESHYFRSIGISVGDRLTVEMTGRARVDYVELSNRVALSN
jgi:hypothetical protein